MTPRLLLFVLAHLVLSSCSASNGSSPAESGVDHASFFCGDGGVAGGALDYDVVVVGAGSGGSAAAIQAARLGARVALVEPTDWVGGQMTAAAVPNMDGGTIPPAGTGLYAEFRQRVVAYYVDPTRFPPAGKAVSTCYWSTKSTCFEPRVGRQILEQMLATAKVDLLLRARVAGVDRSGKTVTGVRLADGRTLRAWVVIDATEHGDLLPLAGAAYRVGNSRSDGVLDLGACIQDLTYVAVVRRYPGGVPPALKIGQPPPGYSTYRPLFRKVVTSTGSSIAFPIAYPVNWGAYTAYRGMPDSQNPTSYTAAEPAAITRTALNWANDFPGSAGALTTAYLEQPAVRAKIDCDAKLMTLSLIHYIQTELGQPGWSVAADEGYDTAYNTGSNQCPGLPATLRPLERLLPVIPYVRESRRLVAAKTLTAKQIARTGSPPQAKTRFKSAIAVGDYMTDLHGCGADADLEGAELGETAADNSKGGPFQVPLEVLIPNSVDGFLAAEKNIGVSRLAAGAIRLQPITMATGQAAGALAALAVRDKRQPRQVQPVDVQDALVRSKSASAVALDVFADVPMSSAFWPAVQLANVHGVLGGLSGKTFGVSQPMTREQAAVMLTRLFALDVTSPPATPTFSDVAPGRWSYAHVEAVYKAGLSSGCSAAPPAFCPAEKVTRAQMAALIARALKLPKSDLGQASFSDVPANHPFFAEIQLVSQSGIMAGCAAAASKKFCPDDALVRGDAARVAARTLLARK